MVGAGCKGRSQALPEACVQRGPGGGRGVEAVWRATGPGGARGQPGRRWNALRALPMFRGLKCPLLHGGAGPGRRHHGLGQGRGGLSSRFEGWGRGNPRQAAPGRRPAFPAGLLAAVLATVCCERWPGLRATPARRSHRECGAI